MESSRPGFDFTRAMRRLCGDLVERLPEFQHIEMDRIAISLCQARRAASHGIYASLTPLRFESGARRKTIGGIAWEVPPLHDSQGSEYLYLLSFYLPRFQNTSFEEKLSTVVHELWHISPAFDGDLRRHAGRYYAHGPSQRDFDAQMDRFAQSWLQHDPPAHLYEFLCYDFRELTEEFGRICGKHWPTPRLVHAVTREQGSRPE